MENIKIGIMGLSRGKEYVKSYTALEGADVVAVCEKDPALVKAALELVPHPVKVCDTYEELLDAGIDAVVLCNYFHEHAKVAIAALNKGISVLSETTAAPTLGECVALCKAAEASTGKYMLGANVPVMYGCRELDRLYKAECFMRKGNISMFPSPPAITTSRTARNITGGGICPEPTTTCMTWACS